MSGAYGLRVSVYFYLLFLSGIVNSRLPGKIRVGSVFLEADQDVHRAFRLGVDSLKSRNFLNETTIDFDIQYAQENDFFHLYTRACLEVNYRIISLFGPSAPVLDQMLESISSNLGIPLISTAPRLQAGGHSEPLSKYTLSLHPTQAQLIGLIKDFAQELDWKEISVIHDPATGILDPTLLAESLQFLGPVSLHQASKDIRATLVQLRLRGARNIIIDTGVESLPSVTQATLDTGMMTKAYSYIFTMLDMQSGNWTRLRYSEALVFGFNMIDQKRFAEFQERFAPPVPGQGGLEAQSRVALTLDSVELLARGLEAFDDSGSDLTAPPSTSCIEERKWELGQELQDAFASVSFDGMTGPISISAGARVKLYVELLKLNYEGQAEVPNFVPVGNWTQGISYDYEGISVPDKGLLTNERPVINKTLVITTLESSVCLSKTDSGEDQGYCVDLAQHLSKLVGFNYKIKMVSDNRYGKPDMLTGQWDGMIGEVARGEADLALADLTVTAARSVVVDFTAPFLQTSLSILYKDTEMDSMYEIGTLLSPFSLWVWVSIGIAFLVTSICLRLVAWLSPLQRDEIILPSSGSSDRSPSLGDDLSWVNSMWVLSSTLVLRGCDIRLQAASSRTIAVVWWMFALVVIVLYASLVSHWFDPTTSKRPQTVDDLLKKGTLDFGVTQGSSSSFFLQHAKREDLQRIWWKIQKSGTAERSFPETVFNGIREVQASNGQYAFVSEELSLNQALVEDCSLGILGPIDTRSFAIAVSKGSPLRDRLSQAILSLGETGVLHQLQEKWWSKPSCSERIGKPKLNFVHFIGPLSLLITGIIIAVIIAMGERLVHHRRSHRGFFRTHSEPSNGKIAMNDTVSDE